MLKLGLRERTMTSDSDIPDSPLTTPPILTPESTGSPDTAGIRKSRRQTAFYPNVNSTNKPQNPFSRSAAKRESVMALGSIEHLQHYFTKTGIAAKKNPSGKSYRGVPAIGGKSHVRSNPSLSPLPELELPPSPVIPPPPAVPAFVKTYETNPESLLPGVVHDLAAVAEAWHIWDSTSHNPELLGARTNSRPTFDVLATLKITTHAIRSIRNYILSLPDESAGSLRAQFRPKSLTASAPVPKRLVSQPNVPTDPLTLVRRSALEVLTSLRELEESSRVPLADDAYDAQSDHGSSSQGQSSHSRVGSPSSNLDEPETLAEVDPDASISYSLVQVHGRYESIPVWEDDSIDMSEEEQEKRDHWDERLVVGGGWLYKQDIRLENLGPEQEVVQRYLDVVDMVLFGGAKDGKRGWEREREKAERRERADKESKARNRRASAVEEALFQLSDSGRTARRVASTGMLNVMKDMPVSEEPEDMYSVSDEESVDDDELPTWAKRSAFTDDELGRAHAILTTFLPESLRPMLPPPANRTTFLQNLSSGQLLCVAYNACVRRSRKPWGYVSKDAIHDIIALEQAAADEQITRGWTFRRTDNLRLWAGALKLRYLLPIITTETQKHASLNNRSSSPSPSTIRFPATETPIPFDASAVARRDEGWEAMLETILLRWANAVVDERRGDR